MPIDSLDLIKYSFFKNEFNLWYAGLISLIIKNFASSISLFFSSTLIIDSSAFKKTCKYGLLSISVLSIASIWVTTPSTIILGCVIPLDRPSLLISRELLILAENCFNLDSQSK